MTVPNNANQYLPAVIQIPSALEITNISQAFPAIITLSATSDQMNTYIAGQKIKMTVPVTYGMFQINGQTAQIISVNPTASQLSISINTINYDAFTIPPAGSLGPATIAPSGSMNLQFNNNTSQISFQSLNNIGN